MALRTRTIFFLSDHTGISVETLGNALLAPFPSVNFERHNLPFIDTISKAEEAREKILQSQRQTGLPPIVFSTLMDPVIRAITRQSDALAFDFLETFTAPLEQSLGVTAVREDIKVHGLGQANEYDDRIDAINFTLAHDDGVDAKRLNDADIILVGVSRAAKTPTCVYLSVQYGVRAANFPITEDDLEDQQLPGSLQGLTKKLFGLTISPTRIQQIRQERRPDSRYASLAQCQFEVRQAEKLYKRHKIPYLETTHLSIEELSTKIMQMTGVARHNRKL